MMIDMLLLLLTGTFAMYSLMSHAILSNEVHRIFLCGDFCHIGDLDGSIISIRHISSAIYNCYA